VTIKEALGDSRAAQMVKRRKFSEGLLDDDHIIRELELCSGQTILDGGCGNGYMTKKFARQVGSRGIVYATDIEQITITNLQKEVKGASIVPLVADITQTTLFAPSFFDLIYLSTVVHIFSDRQLAGCIKEMRRILKPGGILAVVTFKKIDTCFGPPIEAKDSPEELRRKIVLRPKKYVEAGEYFYMQLFEKGDQ